MKINTLKAKVLIWFVGTITIVLFAFSFLLYYFIEDGINLKIQNNLYYSAKDIYDDITDGELDKINFKDEEQAGMDAAIIKENTLLNRSKNFDIVNYNQYLYKEKSFFIKETSEYTINAIYVFNFTTPFKGAVILSHKGLPNKAEDIEDVLLILDPILLLIMIFIGINLVDKILSPIQNMTQLAKRININNFTHTINTDQKEEELKELAQTFNEMIQRLKEGVEKLDRFNSDISHELRTPLTVINTQIELALKKERNSEYYQNSLKKISQESNKIMQIMEDMLLLTKYSKENIEESYSLCDINALLIDTVDKLLPEAQKKNISIEFKQFEKAILKANASLINILFSNLLDNAIKYTPENKHIFLSLFTENENICFIIQDEGIGIPEDSIKKVTDRFYRVDESRNKSIKGFGLGLSLVKNVIDLHKGILKIESKTSKGTTITVRF